MTVTFQLWTLFSVQCSKNTSAHRSVLNMSDLTQIFEANTISDGSKDKDILNVWAWGLRLVCL